MPHSTTVLRRGLRERSTSPELVLWYHLRNRELLGLKFRRQHSIGQYIVDFYCDEKRLVIEVDGDTHGELEQIKYDQNRTIFLESQGIKVVRFTNDDVLRNISEVIEELTRVININSPSPNLSHGERKIL